MSYGAVGEIAQIAQQLFREASLDHEGKRADGRCGPAVLAVGLFSPGGVKYGLWSQVPEFVLQFDPVRLHLRRNLCDENLTMAIARGVARWWHETHLAPVLDEDGVEDLAIALALPDRAFRHAAMQCACDLATLAEHFVCPVPVVRRQLRRVFGPYRSGTYIRLGAAG